MYAYRKGGWNEVGAACLSRGSNEMKVWDRGAGSYWWTVNAGCIFW